MSGWGLIWRRFNSLICVGIGILIWHKLIEQNAKDPLDKDQTDPLCSGFLVVMGIEEYRQLGMIKQYCMALDWLQ